MKGLVMFAAMLGTLIAAGCVYNAPYVKYTCTGDLGTLTESGYGLSGECTFVNSASVDGDACATVRLRQNGAIVSEQKVCSNVPGNDRAKKEFFIGMSLGKGYSWEYV